jgi:Tfp pilus assembly protein PilV
MSRSPHPNHKRRGFSMLEVIIALAVLFIGVSALAALAAVMIGHGSQSKYASLAGTLASEKLEDLNRWNGSISNGAENTTSTDPEICVPSGNSAGGVTPGTDATPLNVTCDSATETVSYADNVSIDVTNSSDCPNPADGCFAESFSEVNSGTTSYYTTYHSPDGTIPGVQPGTAAGTKPTVPVNSTTAPANMSFHRQWLIELNPTINGTQVMNVRRITVLVTSQNSSVKPPVSFQISTVRP